MNYKPILNKIFKSKNIPNLILYGFHSIDKFNILKEFININNCILNTNYNIKYYSNNDIKIIDMKDIKNSQIENLFTIIFEIIKCKNYYSNNLRILILKNFNHINKNIQDRFRVIFEKYRINILFIVITDNYDSILNPIKSRFLSLRIRDLTREEKISITYPYIKKLTYDKRCKIYDTIYKYSNKDIIINYSKNNYGLLKDHYNILENIYYSLKNINNLDLNLIKKYAYSLEKYHIKNFHSDFLKIIINDIKNDNLKLKELVFTISDIEMRYKKSYNNILSNEFLLIFIYKIIH